VARAALTCPPFTMIHKLLSPYDIDSIDNRSDERVALADRWLGGPVSRYFRAEVTGLENVLPGPALFVGNHNAGTMNPEAYILAHALFQRFGTREVPYGLGHEWAISLPGINHFLVPLGAVRAGHDTARRLFQRGHKVIVYPGSDLDALRPFRMRNRIVFGDRTGFVRLALRESVPLLPVVAAGAHAVFRVLNEGKRTARWLGIDKHLRIKTWPLVLSLPWGLTFGPPLLFLPFPSRILVEVLPAIHLDPTGPDAAKDEAYVRRCADHVLHTMQRSLDTLVARRSQRQGPRVEPA